MKRLGLLILLAAVAAGGVVYTVRHAQTPSHTNVTVLLPRTTVGLVHLPDFNRSRGEWRQTDIYKLYQESAVQDFLNRPLSKLPQRDTAAETASEFERLGPKDAFVAVTSIEDNSPHFAGGFRFHGSEADAEKIVGKWRAQIVHNASSHETVDYEAHKIDIVGAAPNQIATVYDGQWFFASNDLAELKAILDRIDQRAKDPQATLLAEEKFRAAIVHLPTNYALLFYVQARAVAEKLKALRNVIDEPGNQNDIVNQIQSICGATRFDSGKMRDVLFVGIPRLREQKLKRSSLDLGTPETFLYLATLINPDRFSGISQAGLPTGNWLQKVFDAAARAGVTVDDWKGAFDLEIGSLADWRQDSRWPSIIATMRVKDSARANKLAEALTHAIDADANWSKTEKDGVVYFSRQTPAPLLAITPTIALSNQLMIVGLDSASVETTIKRSANSSTGLTSSSSYKSATRAVQTPTDAFIYLDTALLYSRLDAALRPMLLMSAAFMPAISDYVDLGKIPSPEIVAKHLSPIVSSQRYEGDGYVTESVGPVTLSEAAIVIGLPAIFLGTEAQHGH